MTIDVNKKYMLTGGQIEDLASRLALTGGEVADKAEKAQTGSTAPTTSTPGEIGQLYIQSDGTVYILKSIVEESGQPDEYTWEEVAGGGVIELTTDDYNWNSQSSSDTPPYNSVALWKLPDGLYHTGENVRVNLFKSTESPLGEDSYIILSKGSNKHIIRTMPSNVALYVANSSGTKQVEGSFLGPEVVDSLVSTSAVSALSANQGKVLKGLIDAIVVPTKTSDLTNDGSDGTSTYVEADELATVATTGAYTDITGTPTNVSDFTNDAGYQTSSQVSTAIGTETTARQNADVNLQGQIDAIVASSDVKDIVGTKADLNNYDTTTLGDNDIIKVLADESQSGATTYYRWSVSGAAFTLIGSEGPYYTKSQTDTLVNAKADASTTYTKTEVDTALSGKANTADVPTVVQEPGGSTKNVMCQAAVTGMVFQDPLIRKKVQIASASTAGGDCGVGIGYTATSVGDGAIALGAGSRAMTQGEMNIGSNFTTDYGYNNSNYRLLTGLYDPQSAHDAATKGYVDTSITSAIGQITGFSYQVVSTLPVSGEKGVIYLVPTEESGDPQNIFEEYIWIIDEEDSGDTGRFELIGTTEMDLSDYVTNSQLNTTLADYVTNSSLSTTLNSYATTASLSQAIINGGTTAPTTATVGAVGTLYSYVDTTGATPTPHMLVCTVADTVTPSYTWVDMTPNFSTNEWNNLWNES